MSDEKCGNCGKQFGKLETPFVYRDTILCDACYEKFAPQKWVDGTKKMRLVCLLVGLIIWPLLLVWIGLGLHAMYQKQKWEKAHPNHL